MILVAMAGTANERTALALRPTRGRIDYNVFNYCASCACRLPKEVIRCPECRQRVRTRPWHRPKVTDARRI